MLTLSLRPYERADAHVAADLVNAYAGQALGFRQATVDGVGNLRLARYVPPGAERVVACDASGAIVGFAYLVSREQAVLHEFGGAAVPDQRGPSIGARLISWAEERARELSAGAPPGARTLLQTNRFSSEADPIALLRGRGFQPVRTWVHYVCELTAPPPEPQPPVGLTLRSMDLDADWDLVGPAMDEAFANHWGAIVLPEPADEEQPDAEAGAAEELPEDESYSNAPGHCFLVLDGPSVVGGVLCNAKLVERADSGRVGSIFVRPAYQRRGVGRALMHAALGSFWRAGLRRVILDTDAESFSDSPRFYQSFGMRPYRHEQLYEKEIRPGRELRRLVL